MDEKSKAYLKSLEIIIDDQKMLALLSSAPLIALVAQIKFLSGLDSIWVQILVTVALFCLSFSGAMSLYVLSNARNFLALKSASDAGITKEDSPYLKYATEVWEKSTPLNEESVTRFAKRIQNPMARSLLVGWLCVAVLVLMAVWSSPGPNHDQSAHPTTQKANK
ncbi:MAG: hypothetical protein AAF557_19885 [Pseudomonadota bacterium]